MGMWASRLVIAVCMTFLFLFEYKWGNAIAALVMRGLGTQTSKPVFNIKCAQQSLINTRPLLFPSCWGELRPFTPERLMLGVKWFHTHTRILRVTTATTPPAAMTPASWFMGCERVTGWKRRAVLSYDNAVAQMKGVRDVQQKREQNQPPSRPRGCFRLFHLLCDTALLFQPIGCTRRQNGNLYCNNCFKFACPLVKGQRYLAQQQWVMTDYNINNNTRGRLQIFENYLWRLYTNQTHFSAVRL